MGEPNSVDATRPRSNLRSVGRREGRFEYVASVLVRSYIHRLGLR